MRFCKSDMFYGAMLSALGKKDLNPVILEPGDNRRIYLLTTDNGDHEIYAKYAFNKKDGGSLLWNFSFTKEELEIIKNYKDNGKKFYFALICCRKNLKGDVAFLSLPQVKECLNINYYSPNYRIAIKYKKGKRGLMAHGTGKADTKAICIKRNELFCL